MLYRYLKFVVAGIINKSFYLFVKDVRDLYRMDKWNREILDKYCRQFKAGILGFLPSRGEGTPERNETLPDIVHRTTAPFRYQVSQRHPAKVVAEN